MVVCEVAGHDAGVVCGRVFESRSRARGVSAPSSRAVVQKLRDVTINHVAK